MKKTFFQKVCLAVVACFMSVMAFADANPFAYNVSAVAAEGGYAVSYQLNAPAEAVNVLIVKDGETVATFPGTTAADELQTVNVSVADLAAGTYNFAIEVTGAAVETAAQFGPTHKFYAPYGCAVDNDPMSEYFGRILVAESNCGARATGYNSAADAGVGTGLYAFTPKMEAILNADGTQGFRGGVEFFSDGVKHGGSALSCKRVVISKDGRIFVSSTTPGLNPLYEFGKDLLSAAPIFSGANTSELGVITTAEDEHIAAMNAGMTVYGEGANLKVVMLNVLNPASVSVSSYIVDDYALGTATTWSAAADSTYKDLLPASGTLVENQCSVLADNEGGIWFCNYRSTADMPSLRHITADGVVDFSETHNNLRQGGLAWSSTGLLAVPTGTKQITVYQVIAGETGPTLTQKYVVTTTCNGDNACYFDYADNLYIVDSSTEVFVAFATPRDNNTVVTPARAEFAFEVGGDGGKHIVFKDCGAAGDNSTKRTTIEDIIASGAELVASIDAASDVYQARTGCGIKYGSSSKAGKLYMTLAEPAEFDSIVIVAAMYGDSEGATGFTVNNVTFPLSAGNKVFEHCVYQPEGVISALNIDQVQASKGRIYMTEIILYPKAGEVVPPTPVADYYLAGNGAEGSAWCDGKNWEVNGTPLVDNTITYTALPAGVYQFKVTNGTWDVQWGYSNLVDNTNIEDGGRNNVKFILCEPCDVTIALNPEANQINLTIVGTYGNCPIEITSMTIVGDPRLIPWAWEPSSVEGDMTKLEDGSYTLTLTNVALQAGENYQYKATANHAWGVKELPAAGDKILTVEAEGNYNVTFTVNAELTELNAVAELVPVVAVPEMNIYAYGLKGVLAEGILNIEYSLNATATAAEVQILAGENVVKTVALTELAKGAHTATIDLTDLADGEYTWAVKAEAAATEVLTLINDPDELQYSFYLPMGLDVDYFPASPHFGNIYVSESTNGDTDGHNETAINQTLGIYVYDPLLQCASENALVGYTGGVSWSDGSAGPRRVKVAEDGLLYICDYGNANRGVYIMDPANPTADFVPLFAPYNAEGGNYGNPGAIDVVGTGADRQVYTIDWDATLYCYRYDIGAENNSSVMPVDIFPDAASQIANGYNNIRYDGKGGFWFAQHRYAPTPYPPLGHVNAAGVMDYAKTDMDYAYNASYRGQIALNKDKTLLAFAGNKVVTVFSIAWNEEGVPAIETLYATPQIGGNIDGVAFDYADNLYVVSASAERMYMYATPKANNVAVVPAAAPIVKGTPVVAEPVYTKVTDAAELNGTFIIVSEQDARAWNGVDINNGYAEVALVGNAVVAEVPACEVEIAAVEGGYSIKVLNGDNAGKYIGGGSSYGNGLKFYDEAKVIGIALNEGVADLTVTYTAENVLHFVYNSAAANQRFRFMKATTVTDTEVYHAVALFKKVGSGTVTPVEKPYPDNQVKVVYSDIYGFDCGFGDWGSGTQFTQEEGAKHFVTTYLGYFGLTFDDRRLNCSAMEALHAELYADADMSLRIVPIHGGAEVGVTVNVTAGAWNEINIPIEQFEGVTNWTDVYQIKIDNAPNADFKVREVYFYTTQAPGADTEAPTALAAQLADASYFSANITATAADNSGVVIIKVYNGETLLAEKTAVSETAATIAIGGLNAGTTYNLTVVAADEAGNVCEGVTVEVATLAAPASAPDPTYEAADVLAVYSSIYTELAWGYQDWYAGAAQAEGNLSDGKKALCYIPTGVAGGCFGIAFAATDVTAYNKLEMDVYPTADAVLNAQVINIGETSALTLVANQWNHIVIDIAGNANTACEQIGFYNNQNMGGAFFVQNIMFVKEAETGLDNATINNSVQKIIENGKVIIIRNGERYSVTGQKL